MRILLVIIRITTLKEIAINNERYFLLSNETRRLAASDTLIAFKLRGVNVRLCLGALVAKRTFKLADQGLQTNLHLGMSAVTG